MLKLETPSTAAPAAAMSAMEAIYQRRSVRSYLPQMIERDVILRLLDAAVHAPTAVKEEPWGFVVLQDRAKLKRLSDKAKELLPTLEGLVHLRDGGVRRFTPPEDVFHGAGTLIAIYGKPLGAFVVADCWLAAENLMVAARSMGLGTCVIGLAAAALNTPEWKAELDVPAEMTAYAPIIVGVPAEDPPAVERREAEILSWKTGLAPWSGPQTE
ncbi:MAG: nitroreductase family protein [Elusimicrobiota bacterium]